MEFKINSKVLEKLLSKIIPAVPVRTPMSILENFLFDIQDGSLTVYATDLEMSLISSINVAADDNIKMVLPAKLLYEIIRSLGDTLVHFEVESSSKIKLTTDNGEYDISYLPHDDFPIIPKVPVENETTIAGDDLRRAFEYTSFAIGKEDVRPAMTGMLFEFSDEGLKFITTDSHRLIKHINKNLKFDDNQQYVIPEKAISILLKLISHNDVKFYFSNSNALFKIDDITFISRLINDKYPAYNSVIPLVNENKLKLDAKEILASVKRMILFSIADNKQVRFSIETNDLEISAEDNERGSKAKEHLHCEYDGEPMEIGFNTIYLQEILNHIEDDEIIFKLHSSTKACIIVPSQPKENEDTMFLLMPIRLNN